MGFNWKDGRRRESLPIDGRLGEIVETVNNNQVVVVEAETGAGKTIRIAQAVLLARPNRHIIMTQLRRNAVRRNGRRIAFEMGCEPGGLVGWRLYQEEPVVSDETRLTLMVEESLVNWIIRNERLPKGTIIWDEAHDRSLTTDTGLGLIKELLPKSPETKLVVTSATIDTKKFSEFFGGAPVISVQGRCYPVSTEVVRLGKYEHHSGAAARAAGMVIERFLKGELQTPTEDGLGKRIVREGIVLVLLPGKEDIAQVMSSINRKAEELKCQDVVQTMSCHAESSPEEQDAVDADLPEGTIRFVCGTEILRSSVTIRGTVGCIDSLQIKRWFMDAKGVAHLDKIAVSKAEADQAKGRPGRISPGFYIACSFEREYENLAPYPMPAIQREPLTKATLKVASIGRSIRTFAFIDPPEKAKVDVAIARLRRLGALDDSEKITDTGELLLQFGLDPERAKSLVAADTLGVLPEATVVTAVLEAEGIFFGPKAGQDTPFVLVDEPLVRLILASLKNGKWGWEKLDKPSDPATVDLNNLPPGISRNGDLWRITFRYEPTEAEIGACEEWEKYSKTRELQRQKEFNLLDLRSIADLTRKYFAGESRSDFVAIVRCYRAFKAEEWRLKSLPISSREKEQKLRDWCFRWFVNFKRMDMAERLMYQIRDEIGGSPLRMQNGFAQERVFSAEALTKALASGLTDHVSRKSEDRGFVGPLGDFQLAYQSACPQGSELVLVGGVQKVPGRGRRGATVFTNLANLAAPVQPEWLAEVMPQLCSKKRLANHRYDPAKDIVVETEEAFFVDLKVGKTAVESIDKQAAAETFCSWLAGQMSI